ncbi:hypothetical protein FNV43_RR15468 [Rhamnella rubrinervis]|uniref:Sulfotransferase n=1 Tax=Rhamnella rubrinervis TaxID=2594499 RepID=A0A8K0E8W5_9ROSA|nr:hypothetical protein FNV43_RR15468 [Rhamnella rubrinervis]
MESAKNISINVNEDDQELQNNIEKLVNALPKETMCGIPLFQYNGTWYPPNAIRGVISSQQLFQADESDLILASFPKSGTTWLKALIFSIVNRNRYQPKHSPLLSIQPHDLVPTIESDHFRDGLPRNLHQLSQPRIFSTHMPYASLPHSIKASNCRIVYVCRNPLDTVVSQWHFVRSMVKNNNASAQPNPIDDEFFDNYCRGFQAFCPFWDNILGYWKVSLEKPEGVLFMNYEDLKQDSVFELKRLASFLGFPFSAEEEAQGLIEEISTLCSFENLKNLEVNQKGLRLSLIPTTAYFRKGEVGDYVNHLTPSMVEILNKLVEEKFAGSGLVFKSKLNS